jgi:hypothetical protein
MAEKFKLKHQKININTMMLVEEWTPAYKGFTNDLKSKEGNFQYEIGKEYVHDGEVVCCKSGFHCCRMLHQTFNYYFPPEPSRYFKVEYRGRVEIDADKISASEIRLVEEVNLYDFYKNHRTYTDDATHLIIDMERFPYELKFNAVSTQRYINERECKFWKSTVNYGEDSYVRWIFNRRGVLDSPGKTPDDPYGKPAELFAIKDSCDTYYYNDGVCTYSIISENYGDYILERVGVTPPTTHSVGVTPPTTH